MVLPLPTSPIRMRFICNGLLSSAEISLIARDCDAVRANGSDAINSLVKCSGPFSAATARLRMRARSRESATWWNFCTIDRGTKDGVATDMAVVTEDGVVGKVTTVAKDLAVVLLVSDESLRMSVSIEGTQEQGIVSGTRASSTYVPDLKIRFLSKTANLKPGMQVLTAGKGGVFPSGLVVGTIKDFSARQLEGIASVTPAVDLAAIQDVFVIVGER